MSVKRKKRYKKKKQNHTRLVLIILILITILFLTTREIINMYGNTLFKTNLTEKNISFQYKENNDLIFIENPKVLSDKEGKKSNNYYTYYIRNNSNEDLNYQIILTPINMISTDNIKIYLTNKKDKELQKEKPYNNFDTIENSKIIYTNTIKKKSKEEQRIRIWLNKKGIDIINFKINVKVN